VHAQRGEVAARREATGKGNSYCRRRGSRGALPPLRPFTRWREQGHCPSMQVEAAAVQEGRGWLIKEFGILDRPRRPRHAAVARCRHGRQCWSSAAGAAPNPMPASSTSFLGRHGLA